MFNFNNYNPFSKLVNAIATEIASPHFKSWVKCKAQHDIQLVADIAVGAIANFISASEYCHREGQTAAALLGTNADQVAVNGLGSAIYKAGRLAFESGTLFRRQCFEGYHGINPNAIALPAAKELELMPPTPSIGLEPLAITPAIAINSSLSFKEWVMMVTRQSALEASIEPHTRNTLAKILRLSGKEVGRRDRRSDMVKAIIAG